jgi:Tfp pilus assembly protein PilF
MKLKTPIFFLALMGLILLVRFSSTAHQLATTSEISPRSGRTIPFRSEVYKRITNLRLHKKIAPSDPKNERELSWDRFNLAMRDLGRDTPTSEKLLKEAIELDHDNVMALQVLSGVYLNEGKKEEARNLATDCLAIDRKNQECHSVLIGSYMRYGEFDDAYQYLADCLLDTPENIHCLGGMQTYYLHNGQFHEAKEILDHLTRLAPDSVWTALAQANYYDRLGNPTRAVLYYDRACQQGQPYACQREKELHKSL